MRLKWLDHLPIVQVVGMMAANLSGKNSNGSLGSEVPASVSDTHQDAREGHGRRLTKAFEAIEAFPALVESRDRLLSLAGQEQPPIGSVVATVESDVALLIAVLRLANRAPGSGQHVDSVVDAVRALGPHTVQNLAGGLRTFDFFERSGIWETAPERFRLHALATQRAAEMIAAEIGYESRDRLMATSLLHDVGKLVLLHAYPGYPAQVHRDARTPEERLRRERLELGVDHAVVGGVLIRRWGLPASIATPVERHHNPDAEGEAAMIRLADMLAHYARGGQISPTALMQCARSVGIGEEALRTVMYDLPSTGGTSRPRNTEPCPLSARELGVLRPLAEGKVYKQIAAELGLSTSTVRTHLHNIYGKIGAVDRAQAVLMATERGWL